MSLYVNEKCSSVIYELKINSYKGKCVLSFLKHNLEQSNLRQVCEGIKIYFIAKKDRQLNNTLIGIVLDYSIRRLSRYESKKS
jgi:hypothetical protein